LAHARLVVVHLGRVDAAVSGFGGPLDGLLHLAVLARSKYAESEPRHFDAVVQFDAFMDTGDHLDLFSGCRAGSSDYTVPSKLRAAQAAQSSQPAQARGSLTTPHGELLVEDECAVIYFSSASGFKDAIGSWDLLRCEIPLGAMRQAAGTAP
jgi:hypothetical protein